LVVDVYAIVVVCAEELKQTAAIVAGVLAVLIVGKGFTITLTVFVPVQPFTFLTVIMPL
jgi:hypothetical protein